MAESLELSRKRSLPCLRIFWPVPPRLQPLQHLVTVCNAVQFSLPAQLANHQDTYASMNTSHYSERLDSASGGARSPASLPRRLLLNSPAPWLLLSTLWTGGPYDLWPLALNVLAIHCCYNKVQGSKSEFWFCWNVQQLQSWVLAWRLFKVLNCTLMTLMCILCLDASIGLGSDLLRLKSSRGGWRHMFDIIEGYNDRIAQPAARKWREWQQRRQKDTVHLQNQLGKR